MIKPLAFIIFLFSIQFAVGQKKSATKTGLLSIEFNHTINSKPLYLIDSTYKNSYQEDFKISKFTYYISNIVLFKKGKKVYKHNGYYLVNHAIDSSRTIEFELPENNYDSIGFIIGVDSAKNVSGSQTGTLDPINGMFWTWNTGYIMQKIDGTSSKSNLVNNKIEYHLGGFKHPYNVNKQQVFPFKNDTLFIDQTTKSTILINVALDKFWKGENPNSIAFTPICASPGELAMQLSQNFCGMFSFYKLVYQKRRYN
jgi:hypothetical protein